MKTVIHMGTYKTGTSTIQSFCGQNPDFLKEHGLYYPAPNSVTLRNQHAHIIDECVHQKYTDIKEYISESQKKALSLGCETLILSSEGFSSLAKEHVEELVNCIGGDVEVVVYFRNVYKYIISTIGQLLKNPSQNLTSGRMARQLECRLDYDKVLHSWDVQGVKKIHAYCFDNVSKALVQNFIEASSGKPMTEAISVKMEDRNIGLGMTEFRTSYQRWVGCFQN